MVAEALSEQALEDVAELGLFLKAEIRAHDGRLRAVSRALGRAPGHLTQTFSGKRPLKMRDVFGIFEALALDPRLFFRRRYPVADLGLEGRAMPRVFIEGYGELTFQDLAAQDRSRHPVPPAAELVERTRDLLKLTIQRERSRQTFVSRALGRSPTVLGQALRTGTDLWAWHLFGTLRVLGVPPSRFFAELFWPDDAGPYRADLVQVLEHLLAGSRLAGAGGTGEAGS